MFDSYHTTNQLRSRLAATDFKCETQVLSDSNNSCSARSRLAATDFKCETQILLDSCSNSCIAVAAVEFGSGVKAITQKYENRIQYNNDHNTRKDDLQGGSTLPLWKTSSHQQISYKNLTAAQKTQAVANGQKELMEMIQNMPESSYELSLKDLVDHHYQHHQHPRSIEKPTVETETEPEPENNTDGDDEEIILCTRNVINKNEKAEKMKNMAANNNHVSNRKKSERAAQIYRSVSLDSGGLLLKMGFPVLWGSRTKKKKNCGSDSVGDEGSRKSVDKEWWVKQRFSGSRDGENGGVSSSNYGSSGSSGSSSSVRSIGVIRNAARYGHNCNPSCWSFFRQRQTRG